LLKSSGGITKRQKQRREKYLSGLLQIKKSKNFAKAELRKRIINISKESMRNKQLINEEVLCAHYVECDKALDKIYKKLDENERQIKTKRLLDQVHQEVTSFVNYYVQNLC
jgi:hypothetical protein